MILQPESQSRIVPALRSTSQ